MYLCTMEKQRLRKLIGFAWIALALGQLILAAFSNNRVYVFLGLLYIVIAGFHFYEIWSTSQ